MSSEAGLSVAVVQHDIEWEDPEANFAHVAPLIAEATSGGAELVILTETFSYGFTMATDRIGEDPDGPSTQFLAQQAAASGAWICGSIPIRLEPGARPRNRLVVAGPDGSVHYYDKMHRFTFGGEHEAYDPGTEPRVVSLNGVRIGLFVCFDLRFAPDFWRLAEDVDAYVVVANWPGARSSHWKALAVARAIENQAYVIAANRIGVGGGIVHCGDSRIVDPLGEVVASADGEECILRARIDPAVVAEVRRGFPFLADRQ